MWKQILECDQRKMSEEKSQDVSHAAATTWRGNDIMVLVEQHKDVLQTMQTMWIERCRGFVGKNVEGFSWKMGACMSQKT